MLLFPEACWATVSSGNKLYVFIRQTYSGGPLFIHIKGTPLLSPLRVPGTVLLITAFVPFAFAAFRSLGFLLRLLDFEELVRTLLAMVPITVTSFAKISIQRILPPVQLFLL